MSEFWLDTVYLFEIALECAVLPALLVVGYVIFNWLKSD